ncbi:MAG: GIY-YIG nuclease family protein [Candidatus Harrisonbacteria bacterium]|nr:GIY-YIG nuclease family protein [Candidatus Harrisonbacteria bacterium]
MAQVITILLPDDNPNGIKIIDLANFNSEVFVVPRNKLKDLGKRSEVNQAGVYFLFGAGEDPSRQIVYIGQSEKFYQRLSNHDAEKEFWETGVIITNKNLDSADIKYLESKSIKLAKHVDRYDIENKTKPEPEEARLSEHKRIVNDELFSKIQFILNFLGFTLFQDIHDLKKDTEEKYFCEDKKNKDARGSGLLLENGEFVVYKGSLVRIAERRGLPMSSRNLRQKLQNDGVLKKENDKSFIFTKDHIFRSPSAAGDVIMGRSVNGWTQWEDKNGKTLDENKRK